MANLIVPNAKPDNAPSEVRKCFLDLEANGAGETNEQWVRACVDIGDKTAAGGRVMSAIAEGDMDVHVFIVGGYVGSQFDPDPDVSGQSFPMVIVNLTRAYFLPSKDGGAMRGTILLFHELGHAAQWISRNEWFMQSKHQSDIRREPYYIEIERDNLEKVEKPMCFELDQPYRPHYDDIYDSQERATRRFAEMESAATVIQRFIRSRRKI